MIQSGRSERLEHFRLLADALSKADDLLECAMALEQLTPDTERELRRYSSAVARARHAMYLLRFYGLGDSAREMDKFISAVHDIVSDDSRELDHGSVAEAREAMINVFMESRGV